MNTTLKEACPECKGIVSVPCPRGCKPHEKRS